MKPTDNTYGNEGTNMTDDDDDIPTWRSPDERVKVHPFRHPWNKGTDIDPECGHTWHDHGWIDRGDHGFTVCPTQAVRPDVLRDREAATEADRDALADDEVALKRDVVQAAEARAAQRRDWPLRDRLRAALEAGEERG